MKNKLLVSELEEISRIEIYLFEPNSYTLDELKYFNDNDSYTFFIIKEAFKIISYAITQETIDFIEIIKLATISEFRKRGHGSCILNKILQESSKNIFIEVSDRDNTKDFYLKNGFKEIGIREKYYLDRSNGIKMVFKK